MRTESLTLDIATIACKWVEGFEKLERQMVKEIEQFLTGDFEFDCPGVPGTAPFIGTWKGTAGKQPWLDLYFGLIQRRKSTGVEYMVGDNTVVALWLESGTFQGVACPPIRINMHFRIIDGLIARLDDDYDTHAEANNVSSAQAQ